MPFSNKPAEASVGNPLDDMPDVPVFDSITAEEQAKMQAWWNDVLVVLDRFKDYVDAKN